MPHFRSLVSYALLIATLLATVPPAAAGWYTTDGPNIVDRRSGEQVILRGFGLGCWLLPEGYMWGIRKVNRPRQFEAAIEDLIGAEDAAEFWRLYYDNFVTEEDVAAMKDWGSNSLRVALLAAMLQPRDGQPTQAPYVYSEENFKVLDRFVEWCERHEIGIIWDLHGAPGGQNAENISDSDGVARLWTERDIYWPRCIDLWKTIAKRYAGRDVIIGYDLLNEPLLRRYDGIDAGLLRELYVALTREIRTIDQTGLIFVEGDDWAQEFHMLEPLDWDPHLVVAFHSYPPTAGKRDLARWERLRQKYNVPLWHGETGEVGPPYTLNRDATSFLEQANVGWSWWTHKKLDRLSQPWSCPRTDGFLKILDYWNGNGPRPSREDARAWLFEQVRLMRSEYCVFVPEMVRSLGLDPDKHIPSHELTPPEILKSPSTVSAEEGGAADFIAIARGGALQYQWLRDGRAIDGENAFWLRLRALTMADNNAVFALRATNARGTALSEPATLEVRPFSGPEAPRVTEAPHVDGRPDDGVWASAARLTLDHTVFERGDSDGEAPPVARLVWDDAALYMLIEIPDKAQLDNADTIYENDGIELFIDRDNSKSSHYGAGDLLCRYLWNAAGAVEFVEGGPRSDIRVAQSQDANGYVMELAVPWSTLSAQPAKPGEFIGFDVHVNDNDGRGRSLKRAWHARRDNAHLSPSRLGTIRLAEH